MPRRKPQSSKQKKAQLQDKRAVKRGEPSSLPHQTPKGARRPQRSQQTGEPSDRRLQSRFIALTPEYLERTRILAHKVPLTRPLPGSSARFPIDWLTERDIDRRLTCPSRPKFKYGQTKKEVEKNEEGWFKKWLQGTTSIVEAWVEGEERQGGEAGEENGGEEGDEWPRSPSWFETNLEVWRQLWRTTENSHILLLLLDSRCPALHLPPSLRDYVQQLKSRKEVILILTKSDLVDATALDGWRRWITEWWGGDVQVVAARAYSDTEKGKRRAEIPENSLEELIAALKQSHRRLLDAPDWARNDPDRLKTWRPSVRSDVDWSGLINPNRPSIPHENRYEVETRAHTDPHMDLPDPPGEGEKSSRDPEKEPLTIGLIGQPNVGKSSLLNALLGESRVRASQTPGKTKHFQTIMWGAKRELRIMDCPGLVCPSLVDMELQALAGILPISQIPSLPACMHYAATVMPLETIFGVPPSADLIEQDKYADKRTWRGTRYTENEDEKSVQWTAGAIMEGRALARGYLTAKSGRPDGNRAANAMMRALANGSIRWGFWPPDAAVENREGVGIWIGGDARDEVLASETDEDDRATERVVVRAGPEESSETEEGASSEEVGGTGEKLSFFAALDAGSDEEETDESGESAGNETDGDA